MHKQSEQDGGRVYTGKTSGTPVFRPVQMKGKFSLLQVKRGKIKYRKGMKGILLAWLGLAWLGLAWLGLAWLGLAWLGLAWLGLAWLGLAWLGLAAY
ncbi:hypothetical protein ACT3I2_17835 [Escherichia coli]